MKNVQNRPARFLASYQLNLHLLVYLFLKIDYNIGSIVFFKKVAHVSTCNARQTDKTEYILMLDLDTFEL